MAFDHKNFATHGLFPGLVTTRSVANLGHFKIEVTIERIRGGGGGARTTDLRNRAEKDKYKVTIRVTYKQRWWEKETIVSQAMASVIAKMTGQQLMTDADPEIEVTSVREVKPDEPQIKVDKR